MSRRVFLDTNVLLYAEDADAGDKARRAQAVVAEAMRAGAAVISTQVLQEYFVVATRKLGLPPEVVRRKVELLSRLNVVAVDVDLVFEAIDVHRLHQVSFWDALVLACARAAGCARLLSEDLQHGATIAGVRVENPFRA